MVQKLTERLQGHDDELASAELARKQAEKQVEELCRIHRREDVNLDYLKGIVVQFLSKPPGSSERESLLPVLATLLQFDAQDYKTIEAGKTNTSWLGYVMPKIISAPTPAPVPTATIGGSTSSEITVSSPPPRNNDRKSGTTLQF
jgi:hypothetical protein